MHIVILQILTIQVEVLNFQRFTIKYSLQFISHLFLFTLYWLFEVFLRFHKNNNGKLEENIPTLK